jgi:hypothetical protein
MKQAVLLKKLELLPENAKREAFETRMHADEHRCKNYRTKRSPQIKVEEAD